MRKTLLRSTREADCRAVETAATKARSRPSPTQCSMRESAQADFVLLWQRIYSPVFPLKQTRVLLLLGLIIGLLPLAVARAEAPRAYTLRMKFTPGQRSRYQVVLHIDFKFPLPESGNSLINMDATMDTVQEQTVVKTREQGGGEVTTVVKQQRNIANGQPFEAVDIPPLTIVYDALGNVLSVRGEKTDGMTGPLSSLFTTSGMSRLGLLLPEKPVAPGETWTRSVTLPNFAKRVTARCKFLRVERAAGFQTARLRTFVTLPIRISLDAGGQLTTDAQRAAQTAAGTGVLTLDHNLALAEGKLIRSAGNSSFTVLLKPKPGAAGKIRKANVSPAQKITMRLAMGINLIP